MSVLQHPSEDRFLERVRTIRAVKKSSAPIRELVERHTLATTILPPTKLWVYDMPAGVADVFAAGSERIPVHFVLDAAGLDDDGPSEVFFPTQPIAVLDMRESTRPKEGADVMVLITAILGQATDGPLPFNARYFAACLKGTGIRGFLWDMDGTILTLFAPGPTYLSRSVYSAIPGTTKDPELYRGISLMMNKPSSPSKRRPCSDAQRWNKLDKQDYLKELDEIQLDALYRQGTNILGRLLREELNGTPVAQSLYIHEEINESNCVTDVVPMQATDNDEVSESLE